MDSTTEPIVAFYIIHDTSRGLECPPVKSYVHCKASIDWTPAPTEPNAPSWKNTFETSWTVQKPARLITFGNDSRCTMILGGADVSPLHCKIYAQLNSGPSMLVIEDCSVSGTLFIDDTTVREGIPKRLNQDRQSTESLRTIIIGGYKFRIVRPWLEAEKAKVRRWFVEHEPDPVTEAMLALQLRKKPAVYNGNGQIGQGGAGKVYRFVEKNTGLLFAVNILVECTNKLAEREVRWMEHMKSFQSSFLAQYYYSGIVKLDKTPEWWTYMSLYQNNLTKMLPQSLGVLNSVMLQMLEAVSFLHDQGILHQDIKPDNFFVRKRQPLKVVLGDFGHMVSLQDPRSLMGDCGTEGFAAPERFFQRHTTALDIYSFGVSFFGMIDFETWSISDWKKCLANITEQPPSSYGGLIKQMVAQDPKARPLIKQCIEVIRRKQYDWGKPNPESPQQLQRSSLSSQVKPKETIKAASAADLEPCSQQGLRSSLVGEQPPTTISSSLRAVNKVVPKRVDRSLTLDDYCKVFARTDTTKKPPSSVPAAESTRLGNIQPKTDLVIAAKPLYNANAKAIHASPAPTNNERVPNPTSILKLKDFAHVKGRDKTVPSILITQKQDHKIQSSDHKNIFAHLASETKTSPPKTNIPINDQNCNTQHHLSKPKRASTRALLLRSPIRKANIDRIFNIRNRLCRIATTTARMAKCLCAGIVDNTCDIALLSIDVAKTLTEVGRTMRALKRGDANGELSVKIGEGMRIVACLRSKDLRFVTPGEWEVERQGMRSSKMFGGEPKRSTKLAAKSGCGDPVVHSFA